jgi:hypothetical protein
VFPGPTARPDACRDDARVRVRLLPQPDRGPAIGSSCLGGLLATGISLVLAWLDVRMVAAVWNRCDLGIGAPANGFVLLVTLAPATLGYLVVLVLGDDAAVRVARPGPGLWTVRLTLLGAVFAVGSTVVLLLHGLPVHNQLCDGEPPWLPF